MRILYLTQKLPFPADSGGPIKTLQTLKILSKDHQIFLVCFAPNKQELRNQKYLGSLCSKVKIIVSNIPFDHFKNIRPIILKSLYSFNPFIVFRYKNKKFEKAVREILTKERIDAIHVDHLNLASYLPKEKNCLWVLEEHNLESEINWGIVKWERWNKFKFFSLLEGLKVSVYEKRMISKFDYILAISRDDKRKLIKLGAKKERVFFLPPPFKSKLLFTFKKKQPVILFIGTLPWWPNKDGLLWFYEKVLPLIKKKVENARFVVIGRGITKEMNKLEQEDPYIKFTGYVKDIKNYLSQASVFVVPLRTGSGIRIKILTALSAGIPVVSTKKGAEGIVSKSSEGVILADEPDDFARVVVRILKNKNQANELSKTGLDFIKRSFNQQKAARILKKVYS